MQFPSAAPLVRLSSPSTSNQSVFEWHYMAVPITIRLKTYYIGITQEAEKHVVLLWTINVTLLKVKLSVLQVQQNKISIFSNGTCFNTSCSAQISCSDIIHSAPSCVQTQELQLLKHLTSRKRISLLFNQSVLLLFCIFPLNQSSVKIHFIVKN